MGTVLYNNEMPSASRTRTLRIFKEKVKVKKKSKHRTYFMNLIQWEVWL